MGDQPVNMKTVSMKTYTTIDGAVIKSDTNLSYRLAHVEQQDDYSFRTTFKQIGLDDLVRQFQSESARGRTKDIVFRLIDPILPFISEDYELGKDMFKCAYAETNPNLDRVYDELMNTYDVLMQIISEPLIASELKKKPISDWLRNRLGGLKEAYGQFLEKITNI